MTRDRDAADSPGDGTAGRRPTIIDVAERAGVSKSLVSRALRGDPGVSPERREAIARSAADLGYRPNSAARSLVRGRSGLIGVVLNEIGNQHHTEIVAGVESRAAQLGASVIIADGAGSPDRLSDRLETMLELRVDGLVLASSWVARADLERAGRSTPTVAVSRLIDPPSSVDTIASDDVSGAAEATRALISAGRTRLGYITTSTSPTSAARVAGVRSAAEGAGLAYEVFELPPQRAGRAEVAEVLRGSGVDGVLCNNDVTAVTVLAAARQSGIRVPDDLAVIGYDDTRLCLLTDPELSSVDQPQRAMGERAIDAIWERANGRARAVREDFPPRLVLRASTGVPGIGA